MVFNVQDGRLEVVAESTFLLEETGAPSDVGAWLRILCEGEPLV